MFDLTNRDYLAIHAPNPTDDQVIADIPGFPKFDNSGYFNGSPAGYILDDQKNQQRLWLKEARIKWRYQYADLMLKVRGE